MKNNLLEIGDRIKMDSTFNKSIIIIKRLTKTLAIGVIENNSKYEYKFQLNCQYGIRKIPREKFSTTDYKLLI